MEIQKHANEISGDEKGDVQGIALDPVITNASPTGTVLADQFNKTM